MFFFFGLSCFYCVLLCQLAVFFFCFVFFFLVKATQLQFDLIGMQDEKILIFEHL